MSVDPAPSLVQGFLCQESFVAFGSYEEICDPFVALVRGFHGEKLFRELIQFHPGRGFRMHGSVAFDLVEHVEHAALYSCFEPAFSACGSESGAAVTHHHFRGWYLAHQGFICLPGLATRHVTAHDMPVRVGNQHDRDTPQIDAINMHDTVHCPVWEPYWP